MLEITVTATAAESSEDFDIIIVCLSNNTFQRMFGNIAV